MSTGVRLIKSLAITPAMLVATNVPEADYPEWSIITTYALGDRIIVAAEHKVFESLQASNVGKSPATEDGWWIEVSPTNRWKPFDLSNSTQMVSAVDVFYEIKPGMVCTALCLLNMQGALKVRVRVIDPTFGLMYDKETSLVSVPAEASWYAWFLGQRTQESQFIALDLPSYPNAVIRVDVTGAPSIGVIMLGQLKTIGTGVRYGARVGIQDYSRKVRNDFGDTILQQGAFAKRASYSITISNKELDNTYTVLASVRGTPCLWIGYQRYACTIVFGFYSEFDISIPYPNESDCSLDIQGLT